MQDCRNTDILLSNHRYFRCDLAKAETSQCKLFLHHSYNSWNLSMIEWSHPFPSFCHRRSIAFCDGKRSERMGTTFSCFDPMKARSLNSEICPLLHVGRASLRASVRDEWDTLCTRRHFFAMKINVHSIFKVLVFCRLPLIRVAAATESNCLSM